jgi:protein-L-isoaspartate(D-aspartate) O-methyltransferase
MKSGWKAMIRIRNLVCLLLLSVTAGTPAIGAEDHYLPDRLEMVRILVDRYDFRDDKVLSAMRQMPRHLFIPGGYRSGAYADHPVPIGEGQTISQPYIVAFMTGILRLAPTDRVLEVGTGSGYQAAVASKLVSEVYTIEIFESLAAAAASALSSLGFRNVFSRRGDGYYGWEEKAPFDAIIVTCAGAHIPPPLLRQLKKGGRMVMPVGGPFLAQNLVFIEKGADGSLKQRNVLPVSFVRLLGH